MIFQKNSTIATKKNTTVSKKKKRTSGHHRYRYLYNTCGHAFSKDATQYPAVTADVPIRTVLYRCRRLNYIGSYTCVHILYTYYYYYYTYTMCIICGVYYIVYYNIIYSRIIYVRDWVVIHTAVVDGDSGPSRESIKNIRYDCVH